MSGDHVIFNGTDNKFNGLQIMINDTESTEITLDNFSVNPVTHNWSADVTVVVRDHFGLDKRDALIYGRYHGGFDGWWILQHMRGYRPFETVVTVKMNIRSQY